MTIYCPTSATWWQTSSVRATYCRCNSESCTYSVRAKDCCQTSASWWQTSSVRATDCGCNCESCTNSSLWFVYIFVNCRAICQNFLDDQENGILESFFCNDITVYYINYLSKSSIRQIIKKLSCHLGSWYNNWLFDICLFFLKKLCLTNLPLFPFVCGYYCCSISKLLRIVFI